MSFSCFLSIFNFSYHVFPDLIDVHFVGREFNTPNVSTFCGCLVVINVRCLLRASFIRKPFLERRYLFLARTISAPDSTFRHSRNRGENYAQRPEKKILYAHRGEPLRRRQDLCQVDGMCQACAAHV